MEKGESSEGDNYRSMQQMWEQNLNQNWYQKSVEYWQKSSPDISGMLGGFVETHIPDINCSRKFLEMLYKNFQVQKNVCIDIGAGIGRVIQSLLINYFKVIDLVEQNAAYVEEAKRQLSQNQCMRNFIVSSAQDFQFTDTYDVIWIQGVLLYLSDEDLIFFLKKCQNSLNETGVIIAKENVSEKGFYLDKQDNSLMRSTNNYMKIFKRSGLEVITSMNQDNWNQSLFPVQLFALK